MKPSCFIQITTLALLLAAGRTMAAEPTNSPAADPPAPTNAVPRLDLSYFQFVSQHNIFDPNRRGATSIIRVGPYVPPVRVDSFALRGTMTYAHQSVANFVGNSSQYSKDATIGDTIAGYKVAEIAFDHVKLAAASNQVVNLPVGSQMKRRDNGPWSLEDNAEPAVEASAPTADKTATTNAPAGGTADDIIKRLMKKHEEDN